MDKHKLLAKGFTGLEMVLVILVISILSSLSLSFKLPLEPKLKIFEQQYLYQQIRAIAQKQTIPLKTEHSNVKLLSFNPLGHVNQGQTIAFDNQKFVVQIGMGRYVIRK